MSRTNGNRKKVMQIGDYIYDPKSIGRGSFSTVYRGFHKKSRQKVAIKEIDLRNIKSKSNRMKSEIGVMQGLDHPNIIKLYDVVYDDSGDTVYLILEYCSNGDLSHFLDKKPMKEKYVKMYIKQLCSGLKYMIDNNIIHRDLKPQNILISSDNTLKLTDFGFARHFDDQGLAETLCGTPLYMAPEIIKFKKYGIKVDLWSLGVIIYEMLFGKLPFKARNHYELIQKIDNQSIVIPYTIAISDECKDLIHRLLQKDPDRRIGWAEFFNHEWFQAEERSEIIDTASDSVDTVYHSASGELSFDILYENEDDKLLSHSGSISERLSLAKENSFIRHSKPIDIPVANVRPSMSTPVVPSSMIKPKESPMFNTPINYSLSKSNGYVIVETPPCEDHDDRKDDNIVRSLGKSFVSYMNNSLNYFKTYH